MINITTDSTNSRLFNLSICLVFCVFWFPSPPPACIVSRWWWCPVILDIPDMSTAGVDTVSPNNHGLSSLRNCVTAASGDLAQLVIGILCKLPAPPPSTRPIVLLFTQIMITVYPAEAVKKVKFSTLKRGRRFLASNTSWNAKNVKIPFP